MNYLVKYGWLITAAVAASFTVIVTSALFLRHRLPLDEGALMMIILIIALSLLTAMALAIGLMTHRYVRPLRKLAEGTNLITSVNPSYRINLKGGREVLRLARIINEMAERFEEIHHDVRQMIQLAMAQTEEEKNILAAIVSELPEGILICNKEGQILLYNKQARLYLEGDSQQTFSDTEADGARTTLGNRFIGLGRSVFGVIEKNLLGPAFDEIAGKLERKESRATAHFITRGGTSRLLRTEAVPILDHTGQISGFVLIFQDILKHIETDSHTSSVMQSLTRDIRPSLANIRAAIEAILESPHMDPTQLHGFKNIIHKESIKSAAILEESSLDYSDHMRSGRPLVRMLGKDLLETIKRRAEDSFGITVKTVYSTDPSWVRVDASDIVLAMLFVLSRLQRETGTNQFTCKLEREGKYANIDLIWQGKPLKIQTLRGWEAEAVMVGKERIPSTLREVIAHHGARMWPAILKKTAALRNPEMWTRSREISRDKAGLRLFLPDVETFEPDTLRKIMVVPESRPDFYDFDLFSQPGPMPELDNLPLTELAYTVFDTEATGLFPLVGDEIISLGAVRIVNGRLLREEMFNQLVNPQRQYWQNSVRIHGIQPEMLEGQPSIDKVLPHFHRFVEDSILVAHNAAFDMCLLRMKEAISGVKFNNPVLDTLLLSAIVHPAQEHHTLEAIADRLGISVTGRHTALGDALATGEILLKLIPLLAQMGITTLGEARLASQKTYYARFKY